MVQFLRVIAFGMLGIEEVGVEIEDPFGDDPNDLPIENICSVVERDTMFSDLPAAVAAFGNDRNVVWCTGPSKTADVEGILIEGVHGPGVQVAWVV